MNDLEYVYGFCFDRIEIRRCDYCLLKFMTSFCFIYYISLSV